MTLRQLLRCPFVDTPQAERIDLSGKQMIVTGCGFGSLGYETAKLLGRWGATVIVTTRGNSSEVVDALKRDLSKDNTHVAIDGHDMDLSDASSVSEFTRWYEENHGDRLDCLVNNAGVHLDLLSKWKTPTLTEDGYEIQWRTNYLGTVQLSHNLLPLLKKTGRQFGEARVVNVVSQLHSRGSNELLFNSDRIYDSWEAYGLSKLGLIHHSNELNRRFAQTGNIKSYCVHPGGRSGTYTNVADKGLEGHRLMGMLRKIGAPIEKLFMATAEEGAQTQIHCATSAQACSGQYYVNCEIADASEDSRDAAAAGRLWSETEPWLGEVSPR
jgi:NAD(P)-dependent dehydrogenase (short-subunit alcohol dehydrogenase family)